MEPQESPWKSSSIYPQTRACLLYYFVLSPTPLTLQGAVQADYENHLNAMKDYVESRKQEGFKSLITENCIAWKDAEVITICTIK